MTEKMETLKNKLEKMVKKCEECELKDSPNIVIPDKSIVCVLHPFTNSLTGNTYYATVFYQGIVEIDENYVTIWRDALSCVKIPHTLVAFIESPYMKCKECYEKQKEITYKMKEVYDNELSKIFEEKPIKKEPVGYQ